jgi:hypothetical protein
MNQPVLARQSNNTDSDVFSIRSDSTVTLRVVGGDEKGSVKSERVKYGHESGARHQDLLIDRQSQCEFDFDFEIFSIPCGGGVNTSTVALRIVGGDGKGSLESETVKYGHESQGTRTRN